MTENLSLNTKLFLLPLFLHVILIWTVGICLLSARIKAVKNGSVKISDIASNTNAWPLKVRHMGSNFDNQFDTPLLWYGAAGLVVALQLVDLFFVGLSWMFLFSRVAHTLVHTGKNHIPSRMRIFLFGFAVLLVMWGWFGFKFFVLG
jgi:hypothetical protein